MPPLTKQQKQRKAALAKGREALEAKQEMVTINDTVETTDEEIPLPLDPVGDFNDDPDQKVELEANWFNNTLDLLDIAKEAGSSLRSVYTGRYENIISKRHVLFHGLSLNHGIFQAIPE